MSPRSTLGYEVDDGVPATIRIVPGDPGPETQADGVPAAMLYVSGATGLLTAGVRWWPSEAELAAVRADVAASAGRSPADFVVGPDAFVVSAVVLVLTPGRGRDPVELARATPSGTPPHTALFSVDVSEHLTQVRRACLGEPGLLEVRVEAELTRGRSATTVLTAGPDLRPPDLAALAGGPTTSLASRVDAMVAAGLLQRTRAAVPGPGPDGPDAEERELAAEADLMAAQRLVALLAPAPVGPGGTTVVLTAAATAHRPRHLPLVRTADVGRWLRGSPARHVLETGPDPDAGPPDRPAELVGQVPVALGFAVEDAPVAEVEVRAAGGSAVLTPPFEGSVTVPAGEALTVTTHYTGGGPAFHVTVPGSAGPWRLSPGDLGLTRVTLDATRLRDAGATTVDADVFYQPADRGSPDRRTVRLGPDGWVASWYVVSRSAELAGQLLLGVLATPAGVPGAQPTVRSTTASILL